MTAPRTQSTPWRRAAYRTNGASTITVNAKAANHARTFTVDGSMGFVGVGLGPRHGQMARSGRQGGLCDEHGFDRWDDGAATRTPYSSCRRSNGYPYGVLTKGLTNGCKVGALGLVKT